MNTRLLVLGWVVFLVITWLFVPRRDTEGSLEEERFVLLDIGDDGAFRVRVDSDEGIRIVAHLEVPQERAVDSKREFTWGVGLSLIRGSEQPVSWMHHLVSRVLVDAEGVPLIRSTRPGRRVTDSRVIDLDPGFAVGGAVLEVSPASLPPDTRLLVRIFEVTGGTAPGRLLTETWNRAYPALTPEEHGWYASWRRQSKPPDTLTGGTVAVLRRPSPDDPLALEPLRTLHPGQATAYNVVGPARIRVEGVLPGRGAPIADALSIDVITTGPATGPVSGELSVPATETWSVRVQNNATVPVQPVLSYDIEPARWGDPPIVTDGRLRPEERRVRLFRLGSDRTPLRVPVDSGTPTGLLRVDARATRPGQPVTVRWVARDADDAVLAEGDLQVPWIEAPFERYADPTAGLASEATTRFVLHPQAARSIEWVAEDDVDVRFLVPLGAAGIQPDVYDLPTGQSGRYATWERAPWISLSPADLPGLLQSDRVRTLIATVRIDDAGVDRDALLTQAQTDTDTVFPAFGPPRFPILERSESDGPFQRWHRTQVGTRTQLVVPDDGTVTLEHRLARSEVGKSASLRCGSVTATTKVRSSRGVVRFRGLPSGSQQCTLAAPRGLWFAKHAGSGARWAHRTLYRVDDRTLSLRIPPLDGVETLYVRAYTPTGSDAPTLIAEVDGGVRSTVTSMVSQPTVFARYYVPDEVAGTALLDNGGGVDKWTGMRMVLGDDLAEGEHTIEVQATSSDGSPVYVRFYSTWDTPSGARTLHWPEVGE